jgi:hypothetical protein
LRRKIKLKKLDHSRNFLHQTIGISAQEFSEVFREELEKNRTLEELEEKLGISSEETIGVSIRTGKISKTVAELWKIRQKEKISLKTFVQTTILVMIAMKTFKKFLDEMANLIELVKEKGTEVGLGTPDCKEWIASQGSCENCPFELGCKKVFLLYAKLSGKDLLLNSIEDLSELDQYEEIKKILKVSTLDQINKFFIS